jgi:hypothetical protein
MRHVLIFSLALTSSAILSAHAQQVTARDAFWSAADLVSVSSNPAAKPATKAPPTTHPTAGAKHASGHVDPNLVASNGYGEQPHLVRVSEEQIGLRYSLLLRSSDGTYAEASPKAIFHSGDHLRLSIMANQPGYLYVIQQGSTGSWSPVFPASGSPQEANKIEQGHLYQVPDGKSAFRFDQNPGQEKLFIVLSRQPIQDFDRTIQGLKHPSGNEQAPAPNSPTYLEASNHIPDELVQRFATRDLTLVQEQDVDSKAARAGDGEKAVYVVSKGSAKGAGPQVVASVTLRHE